jgi:hypothetical protein
MQEVLHWYNLRMNLAEQKYAQLLSSKLYWGAVSAFIFFSGAVCIVWFWDAAADPKTLFVFGASLPALMKQVGNGALAKSHLGTGELVNDYFLAR